MQRVEGTLQELAGVRLACLVLSPDFPPSRGGIQELLERIIRHAPRLEPRVVTMSCPGDAEFDARQPYPSAACRGFPALGALSFLWLNAVALREAWRSRPSVVLSGHIVTGLAAWAISRLLRLPSVQYLHADEVRAAPRLAELRSAFRDRCRRCQPAHRRASLAPPAWRPTEFTSYPRASTPCRTSTCGATALRRCSPSLAWRTSTRATTWCCARSHRSGSRCPR